MSALNGMVAVAAVAAVPLLLLRLHLLRALSAREIPSSPPTERPARR